MEQRWAQAAGGASRAEVVVLVGLQASGKSTFYRQRFAGTHSLVSRDLFRNHRRPSERQRILLEEELRAGHPVVVDNTSPTAEDRAAILSVARDFGVPAVCYFFPPDVNASLARNARRQARERVPAAGIFATRKRLAPPTLAEGFDRLFEVEVASEGDFRVREVAAGGTAPGGAA